MLRNSGVWLLPVVATVAGCANLNVTMQVLDPQVVRKAVQQETVEVEVAKVARAQQSIKDFQQALAAAPQTPQLNVLVDAANSLGLNTRQLPQGSAGAMRMTVPKSSVQAFRSQVLELQATVAKNLPVTDSDPALKTAAAEVKASTDALFADVPEAAIPYGGSHIAGDPFTFAAVTASDEQWGGGRPFNVASGSGMGGDVDVAIKLNKNGGFTVKGFSFNPADAAATMTKVTAQVAIQTLGAVSGVNLGVSFAGTGTDLGTTAVPNLKPLATLEGQRLTTDAAERGYRDALLSLAKVVAAQYAVLSDSKLTDDQRKVAVDRVNAALKNLSPRLSPTDIWSTPTPKAAGS